MVSGYPIMPSRFKCVYMRMYPGVVKLLHAGLIKLKGIRNVRGIERNTAPLTLYVMDQRCY